MNASPVDLDYEELRIGKLAALDNPYVLVETQSYRFHGKPGEWSVSSLNGGWLPGLFDSLPSAKIGVTLHDSAIIELQEKANSRMLGGVGGRISQNDMKLFILAD